VRSALSTGNPPSPEAMAQKKQPRISHNIFKKDLREIFYSFIFAQLCTALHNEETEKYL
jgi:hypothetical protein